MFDLGPSKRGLYSNMTPWIARLFFVHTYYAYMVLFYMILTAFYKGYALDYPKGRFYKEMALVMIVPLVQHAHFYFGNIGCKLGMPRDLCWFLFFCTVLMWMLMYLLFWQTYIVPLESKLCFVSAVVVTVEGTCGVVNVLQTLAIQPSRIELGSTLSMITNVLLFIITVAALIVFEFMPAPEEEVIQRLHPAP
jgi:Kef-type K+ transport system membrane component KefB